MPAPGRVPRATTAAGCPANPSCLSVARGRTTARSPPPGSPLQLAGTPLEVEPPLPVGPFDESELAKIVREPVRDLVLEDVHVVFPSVRRTEARKARRSLGRGGRSSAARTACGVRKPGSAWKSALFAWSVRVWGPTGQR